MAQDETDETGNTSAAPNTPRKVRGLLDIIDDKANAEAWVFDDSDPLAEIGLGLGATPEARRLVMLGILSERAADLDRQLAELKPKRGRPKGGLSIDFLRAAAVLGADEFFRDRTGQGAPTQKAAIELAVQIDQILYETGERKRPLFGQANQMKRWQDSVSKGLRELGSEGQKFLKK